MTQVPLTTVPKTAFDAYFDGPATVYPHAQFGINGKLLLPKAIQRLAGCPTGGEIFVAKSRKTTFLESRHPTLIVNACRNANYIEIRQDEAGSFLYLDYIWFSEICPKGFGGVALLLMAYEAHRLGFTRIELLAAGGSEIKGRQWSEHYWGYETWPRLGFDAHLQPEILSLMKTEPKLDGMTLVSQVVQADLDWWKRNGDGWEMSFDLAPQSASWVTLHKFCVERRLVK